MKKLIWLTLGIALICNACDHCEDCGPYTKSTTSIFNSTNQDIELQFFSDSIQINKILVRKHSSEALQETSYEGYFGLLENPVYYHDSLHYINENDSIINRFYRTKNCDTNSLNPLCEENYLITKDETDKKGNRNIEKVFVID